MRYPKSFSHAAIAVLMVISGITPTVCAQAPAGTEPAPSGTAPAEPAANPAPVAAGFEQQLAERLALSRFDADMLWLETTDGPFLALHRPADEPIPFGGLVINAAPGSMVDNAPVLRAVAAAAAAGGWSVLSLQPVARGADPAAAGARIGAAVAHFAELGVQNIVLVSDGAGASMTLAALAENASPALVGFVGLGAWKVELTDLDVAILDVAGTRDARALRWQQQRKARARDYPNLLETVAVDGAGPDFRGYAEQTAKRVRGWLRRAAPARVVTR